MLTTFQIAIGSYIVCALVLLVIFAAKDLDTSQWLYTFLLPLIVAIPIGYFAYDHNKTHNLSHI